MQDTDSAPNPLFEQVQAAVDQYGVSPPTRTRSRRHGHLPQAREHVENYLAHVVLGQSVRVIARGLGKAPSTVQTSIDRGKRLVKAGSDARGFQNPDGRRLECDPDDDRGFSDPDEPGE